jgi:CHAT domain-containing protein
LHSAGARTAVTSLWPVGDEETKELMGKFYTHLWGRKEPPAKALWLARMEVRKAGRPQRDWAGWVLTGSPD